MNAKIKFRPLVGAFNIVMIKIIAKERLNSFILILFNKTYNVLGSNYSHSQANNKAQN